MRVYSQNLQKQTTKIFKTGGRTPSAPVLDPPLYRDRERRRKRTQHPPSNSPLTMCFTIPVPLILYCWSYETRNRYKCMYRLDVLLQNSASTIVVLYVNEVKHSTQGRWCTWQGGVDKIVATDRFSKIVFERSET